jgi:RNA polymerase primary sigma factor
VHVRDKLYRIYDIVIGHECDECAGIDPCPGLTFEVAVALDCSVENAERYLQFFKPYDSVDEIITTDPLVLSDHGCSEDDLIETHDRKELKLLLGNVISIITPKEKEVLQLRFGLLDGEERTLEQIGNALGVSRERIRQIEAKAIRKLQHPTRIRYLKGLAEQMF